MSSITQSVKILNSLRVIDNERYSVSFFINGRERGFAVAIEESGVMWDDMKVIVFAEHRSSDAIIVQVGTGKEFTDPVDGVIKPESIRPWKEQKSFDSIGGAIDFILEEIA